MSCGCGVTTSLHGEGAPGEDYNEVKALRNDAGSLAEAVELRIGVRQQLLWRGVLCDLAIRHDENHVRIHCKGYGVVRNWMPEKGGLVVWSTHG